MVWTERTQRRLSTPWDGLWRLGGEADRFLRAPWAPSGLAGAPPVNLYASDEGLLARVCLPGFDRDSVEVRLDDDRTLHLRADAGESRRRPFARRLRLPFRVAAEGVRARFEAGVLEVELPRRPEDRPRNVPIERA